MWVSKHVGFKTCYPKLYSGLNTIEALDSVTSIVYNLLLFCLYYGVFYKR